jgi:hypothetical protein
MAMEILQGAADARLISACPSEPPKSQKQEALVLPACASSTNLTLTNAITAPTRVKMAVLTPIPKGEVFSAAGN